MAREKKIVTKEITVTTCDLCGGECSYHQICHGCGKDCCTSCCVTHYPNPFEAVMRATEGLVACRPCGKSIQEVRDKIEESLEAHHAFVSSVQREWIESRKSK